MKHRYDTDSNKRVELLDHMTALTNAYKCLQSRLSDKNWRGLAEKLSEVEYQARCAGFAVNSIIYDKSKVLR